MQPLDITDRIREHAERLDAETSPVLFTELRGPNTVPLTEADTYASRPLHGWMVAAVSAVAVLLLIGGSIALLNVIVGDLEPEIAAISTTIAAPSTAAGVTSTTAAPQVVPPVLPEVPPETPPTIWTPIDTEMAAQSAASGPLGVLALDRMTVAGEVLLWSSSDGMTWSSSFWPGPVSHDPMASPIDTVTYAGSRYFVFGGHWGIDLWSSTDGVDWVAADHIDAGTFDETVPLNSVPGTYGRMKQIAYGNETYLAVGDVRDHGGEGEGYSNPRAAVWTSSDAFTWTRLPEDHEAFDGPWHQEMVDVAFGPAGFVAVGSSDGDDGQSSVAAIWHSQDGFTWTRIIHDPDLFGEQIQDEWWGLWGVAYGDGAYIAIGTGGRVLTSEDGLAWSLSPFDEFGEDIALVAVAYGDGSFVVAGNEWSSHEADGGGRTYVPAIWYSADATSWVRVGDDTDLFGGPFSGENSGGSRTVTFGDSRFFVVGHDQVWLDSGESDFNGRVWIGKPVS